MIPKLCLYAPLPSSPLLLLPLPEASSVLDGSELLSEPVPVVLTPKSVVLLGNSVKLVVGFTTAAARLLRALFTYKSQGLGFGDASLARIGHPTVWFRSSFIAVPPIAQPSYSAMALRAVFAPGRRLKDTFPERSNWLFFKRTLPSDRGSQTVVHRKSHLRMQESSSLRQYWN